MSVVGKVAVDRFLVHVNDGFVHAGVPGEVNLVSACNLGGGRMLVGANVRPNGIGGLSEDHVMVRAVTFAGGEVSLGNFQLRNAPSLGLGYRFAFYGQYLHFERLDDEYAVMFRRNENQTGRVHDVYALLVRWNGGSPQIVDGAHLSEAYLSFAAAASPGGGLVGAVGQVNDNEVRFYSVTRNGNSIVVVASSILTVPTPGASGIWAFGATMDGSRLYAVGKVVGGPQHPQHRAWLASRQLPAFDVGASVIYEAPGGEWVDHNDHMPLVYRDGVLEFARAVVDVVTHANLRVQVSRHDPNTLAHLGTEIHPRALDYPWGLQSRLLPSGRALTVLADDSTTSIGARPPMEWGEPEGLPLGRGSTWLTEVRDGAFGIVHRWGSGGRVLSVGLPSAPPTAISGSYRGQSHLFEQLT